MQTLSVCTIADLVVILKPDDKAVARNTVGGRAARTPASRCDLSLIQPPIPDSRRDVLGAARKVGIVAIPFTSQMDVQLVMEVIGPHTVQTPSTSCDWPHDLCEVPIVFRNNDDAPVACRGPHP